MILMKKELAAKTQKREGAQRLFIIIKQKRL